MGWGITRVHVSCQGGGGAKCHWESVGGFFSEVEWKHGSEEIIRN